MSSPTTRVIEDPNSQPSQLIDQLKHISSQNQAFAEYDEDAPPLVIEQFIVNHLMNKFLIIAIILFVVFLI